MVDHCLFFLSQGFVTFDSCEAAEKAIDEVCNGLLNLHFICPGT